MAAPRPIRFRDCQSDPAHRDPRSRRYRVYSSCVMPSVSLDRCLRSFDQDATSLLSCSCIEAACLPWQMAADSEKHRHKAVRAQRNSGQGQKRTCCQVFRYAKAVVRRRRADASQRIHRSLLPGGHNLEIQGRTSGVGSWLAFATARHTPRKCSVDCKANHRARLFQQIATLKHLTRRPR
jgi:hypothetical protein